MDIKRLAYTKLIEWKNSKHRLPLIIKGARQVGKTYLVEKFAQNEFKKTHIFNFESDEKLKRIFEPDLNVERIISDLSFVSKEVIGLEDLIFFDEIQECPRALTSLKYFAEKKPKQAIISAGSLLGVLLNNVSYPVGKVDFLWLGPLNFKEFLIATGDEASIAALEKFASTIKISEVVHLHLMEQFRRYSVVGGLPGVVNRLLEFNSFDSNVLNHIRKTQENLLRTYMGDFSKYSEKANALHIRAIFENIPHQLSQVYDGSTKKFKFSQPIQGKKGYAQLQGPIEWLDKAGLVYKIMIANRSELPLSNFCKDNVFKLFIFDIGILGALLKLPPESIYKDDYGLTRGYFAESICLQALIHDEINLPICWMEGNSEIEFMIIRAGQIVPVEVKSGSRKQAKSLSTYIRKYSPNIAIKFHSGLPSYDARLKLYNLPIYTAHLLNELALS